LSGISRSAGGIPIPARARRRVSIDKLLRTYFLRISVATIALGAPSKLQHKYIAARESHLKRKVDIQPHAAPGMLVPASNLRATGNHAPLLKT